MKAVWFGHGDLGWLEPEVEEEREFIEGCPKEWGWDRIFSEWGKKETECN
jgi:hypothetical protein